MSFNFQRLNKATTPASDSAAINQFVDIYRRAIDAIDPDLTSIQSGDWAAMVGDLKGFENFLRQIFNPLRAALAAGGIQQEAPLSRAVNATMRFDITDPRAIAYAQDRVGELIAQVTDEVKQTVRDVVARAYREGRTIDQIAAELRNSIGLHDRWARAVENYQRRQFEQLVKKMPYDTAMQKAAALAEKYRARLIRKRAMTIARTETAQASMYGRYLSWLQAADSGLIDPYTTGKRWLATRPCDRCKVLNSKPAIGMLEPFSNGKLMPPDHPNCKCRAVLIPNWKASNRPVVVQKAYKRKYATQREAAQAAANARWGNRTPDVPAVKDKPTKKVDPVKDAYRAFQAEAKKKNNLEKTLELEKVWLNAVRDNAPPKGEWRECGSVKEAMAQFYGQGWTTETYFGKLSVPMVNDICKTWNELGTKYPEVAYRIDNLGGHSGLRDAGKLPVAKMTAMAYAFYGPRTIAFNDSYSRDQYEEIAQRSEAQGWHPQGTGSKGDGVRSVLIHEFGHMVGRQTGLGQVAGAVEGVRLSRPAGVREKSQKEFVKTNLSEYGTKNSDETFAEAFTEYHMSPNPRPLATAIIEDSFAWIGKTEWKRDTVAKAYKRKFATREEAARFAANARWGGKKADAPGSTSTAAAEWTDLPTTAAVQQELESRFPNITVRLAGLQPDVANEAAAAFVENAALFPEVVARIGVIQGNYQSSQGSARRPLLNRSTGQYEGGIIRISSGYSKEQFDEFARKGQESGFFVAGTYDPTRIVNGRPMTGVRSVISHEFGHHVDYYLRTLTDTTNSRESRHAHAPASAVDHDKFIQSQKLKLRNKYNKEQGSGLKIGVKEVIGKTVSRYATTNNLELFAESFNEYYSSPNPRPAARTIIESAFANVSLPVPSAPIEKAYKRKYATRREAAQAAARARWGNRAPKQDGASQVYSADFEPWENQQGHPEIEAEMRRRFPHLGWSFRQLNVNLANEVAASFVDLADQYPEVAKQIKNVGDEIGMKDLERASSGYPMNGALGDAANGLDQAATPWIRINSQYSKWGFDEAAITGQATGFKVKGIFDLDRTLNGRELSGVRATMTHEFGHHVDYWLTDQFKKKYRIQGYEAELQRNQVKWAAGRAFGGTEKGLSKYATRNPRELFAEAFTEYQLSDSPRGMSRRVIEDAFIGVGLPVPVAPATVITKAYKRKYGSREEAARAAANARWGNRAKADDTATDSGSVDRYVPSEKLLNAIDKAVAKDTSELYEVAPKAFDDFAETPEGKELISKYAEKVYADTYDPERAGLFAVRKLYQAHKFHAAERAGYSERIEANEKKLKKILATQPVVINMTSDDFEKVFQDGRFKTQFETGDSQGSYDPMGRMDAEAVMFGYPLRRTPPEKRPVYGSIPPTGAASPSNSPGSGTWLYGDVRVVLKDAVKDRTTFTTNDSLAMSYATSPVKNPSMRGVSLAFDRPFGTYIEAQVHGGVQVSDIKEIVVRDGRLLNPGAQNPRDSAAAKIAKQLKIPLRAIDLDGVVSTIVEAP